MWSLPLIEVSSIQKSCSVVPGSSSRHWSERISEVSQKENILFLTEHWKNGTGNVLEIILNVFCNIYSWVPYWGSVTEKSEVAFICQQFLFCLLTFIDKIESIQVFEKARSYFCKYPNPFQFLISSPVFGTSLFPVLVVFQGKSFVSVCFYSILMYHLWVKMGKIATEVNFLYF